ncbi:MAG TPA: hypothetical protein VEA80_09155 [Vitreimonas sp.]|uniref:hypothetical protein n=1 Tax=Vitreimonas sp. TaxID=3069702 RepID=UPI002D4D7077|nr:hypothetical protein [Vitreimonas sp.]HYD87629.1 hypothetical protein [Vitreimonas sp.]
MSHDNVTPFRRPPKRPAVRQQGGWGMKTHRGKVVLAHLLTIAAFALNLVFRFPPLSYLGLAVGIAGVVLVYSNRGAAMPWANTHHEHALRTLMIGYAIWALGSLLSFVHDALTPATLFIQFGAAIWAVLRAVIALALGVMRKPVPHPHGWLV